MTPNTMMKPETTPKMQKQCMSAVEYFQAKLDCEMTPWTLKGMMDQNKMAEICLIDVRSNEDFAKCNIPGAMCMPLASMSDKMNSLPKDKMIVAYCGDMSCGLAPKACLELAKKGFKVMELCGGLATWTEKGFPVNQKA